MTPLTSSFDILNPEHGPSAINELFDAWDERREAKLTLSSPEDGEQSSLRVAKFRLELDNTGLLLLTGETALGEVTGRLIPTNAAGKVGRVTIAIEGV